MKKNRWLFFNLLIYLLIFLLPTQLGKHFFFDFSYVNGLRVDYLAPTLYLTDIIALVLIIFYRKEIVLTLKKHWQTVSVTCGLLFLNAFFSLYPILSLYKALKLFEILSLFIIFSQIKLSKQKVFLSLLGGAVLTLFLSLVQLKTGHSLQGLFYFLGERQINLSTPSVAKIGFYGRELLRPYGTFSHPNSLAGFYLLIYTFVLYGKSSSFVMLNLFQHPKKILNQVQDDNTTFIIPFLLLASAILIFISFSKIAILALLLITVLHAIFERKGCLSCRTATIFVFLAIALLFLQGSGDPESLGKRLLLNSDAMGIIHDNLIWGVGLGHYVIAQAKIATPYPYFFLQPVHDIFLLFLAETGIFITSIVFYLLSKFVYNERANKTFLACILVVFATGLFDHYWLTLQQNILLLGVVFGFCSNRVVKSAN